MGCLTLHKSPLPTHSMRILVNLLPGILLPDPRTDFVVTGPEAHYSRIETTDHDGTQTTGYEYSVEIDIDESTLWMG